MQVDAERRGAFDVAKLRDPGGNRARQHVAGAARRHAGIAAGVDERLPRRRGDDRPVALQDDKNVVVGGEVARDVEASGLHVLGREPGQPRHLARMRRDDDGDVVAALQPIDVAGKGVEAVGVDHERHAGALDQRLHHGLRGR